MALHSYFKLVGIEPGKVVTSRFGVIDFSLDVPFDVLKTLFDSGFPYLKLSTEGKRMLTPPRQVVKFKQKTNAGKSKKMD
jgi:hypothetical protein